MKRSAIKTDLFAADKRREKLDALGDPLVFLERHMDFAQLAAEVDRVAPRPVSDNGGGLPVRSTQTGGKLIRTIGLAQPKFTMTMRSATYHLKRLVFLKEARIASF